jgi:peptidoglycan/LPS O-acetylase OafA/YrhL
MTATATRTVAPTTDPGPSASSPSRVWRTGLAAGLVAAAATVAVAAAARTLDVSLETAPSEAIPVLAFGPATLFCTAIGTVLARLVGGRLRRPRQTFTRVTVALTGASIGPDLLLSADAATKLTLVLTHVVAAAVVIPALASRLPARGPGGAHPGRRPVPAGR